MVQHIHIVEFQTRHTGLRRPLIAGIFRVALGRGGVGSSMMISLSQLGAGDGDQLPPRDPRGFHRHIQRQIDAKPIQNLVRRSLRPLACDDLGTFVQKAVYGQIFYHPQRRKQREILINHLIPGLGGFHRIEQAGGAGRQSTLRPSGTTGPRRNLDDRRFARADFASKAMDFARYDRLRDIIKRNHAAKALRDAAYFD
jgi:hypothetical protein